MSTDNFTKHCMHCGKEVHLAVDTCPFCGKPTGSKIPTAVTKPVETKPKISMKFLGLAIILFVAGLVIGFGSAPRGQVETVTITQTVTYTPSSMTPQIPTEPTGKWSTIATFQGSGVKTTEQFYVPTDYWRLKYTVQAETEEYAHFSIWIKPALLEMISFHQSGTDISYIYEGPGYFHLEINAANLKSWTIEVQIQK